MFLSPYRSKSENRLAFVWATSVLFTIFAAIALEASRGAELASNPERKLIMDSQLTVLVQFAFWFAILYTLYVLQKQVKYRMNPTLALIVGEAYANEEADFARQKAKMKNIMTSPGPTSTSTGMPILSNPVVNSVSTMQHMPRPPTGHGQLTAAAAGGAFMTTMAPTPPPPPTSPLYATTSQPHTYYTSDHHQAQY